VRKTVTPAGKEDKREESGGEAETADHPPSADPELITGVIGGVLDLLKVNNVVIQMGPGPGLG